MAIERIVVDELADDSGGDEGDLVHVFCKCSPDLGLCSTELHGPVIDDFDTEEGCVVCIDMTVCPRCGGTP